MHSIPLYGRALLVTLVRKGCIVTDQKMLAAQHIGWQAK